MILYSFILLFSVAEAKKGGDAPPATASTAAPATPEIEADVPSDGNSKKFAKALVGLDITKFRPISDGLIYDKLTFNADNSWEAQAAVEMMDEKMECIEKGTWTMDPAESATIAIMTWKIDSTDCPSRTAPDEIRLKVTITGNGIQTAFR